MTSPDFSKNFDFCRFRLPPEPSSWGQGRQKNENRRLMMPCTIPETSCCTDLGNMKHLHGKLIFATCGPKYEQKHAFSVTEGKRERRLLPSQKNPARSFLDPDFDGESEFQRVRSSKYHLGYDMSVKRPKNTILGRNYNF